jgi:hypothetical protein
VATDGDRAAPTPADLGAAETANNIPEIAGTKTPRMTIGQPRMTHLVELMF